MNSCQITIKCAVLINKPRETVWDYTQNYDHRPSWDKAVLETTILQTVPNRVVKLKVKGNTTMIFQYKQDDRPHKTSLATTEVISPIIESAGGSWTYEEQGGQTLWKQTNTIILKRSFVNHLLLPFYKFLFALQTKQAMNKAKSIIEHR